MKDKIRFLTAPLRVYPDFIILGEAKCGTTSLYRYLNQLQTIMGADVKEPNNFRDFGGSPLFCKMHFPTRMTYLFRKWRLGQVQAGEASAEYFSKPSLPKIVHDLLPQVKLICLFRDPVKRAYSDWQMLTNAKRETRSFQEVVEHSLDFFSRPDAELLLSALDHLEYHPLRYVARGVYIRPLLRWKSLFPSNQICCLPSESLFQNPAEVIDEVCAYLDLPLPTENLQFDARKKGKYTDPCPPELTQRLQEFYRPWNQKLAAEAGSNFTWDPAES